MSKIRGRFYFKLQTSGNIIGEFSNYLSESPSTESADRLGSQKEGFAGEYLSTWQEYEIACFANLIIEFKPKTNNTIYSLLWLSGKIEIFRGEGMLCDNILIGDYQSVD
jgi:hypothetical protein